MNKKLIARAALPTLCAVSLLLVIAGCISLEGNRDGSGGPEDHSHSDAAGHDHGAVPNDTSAVAPVLEKSGAQLWAENCRRCHNFRSPAEFSDAQWDIVGHHMRVRANLTAAQHLAIIEFLKSGN